MNPVISQTFAVTAVKPTISVDHIDNYYITEASGIMPAVSDSRWQLVPDGQQVPVPTASAPYLWHKYITYLTDGSALDPIVEFAGSLGQNGFDYDLVPSHSAIIKDANDNLSPANVSCSLIKRNADGSAETQSVVPSGYSVIVYRDNTSSSYTLGSNVSTAGITSVITFVLKYGNIEVERHDLRVIAEGAEGLTGRGIQSQDTRFKATTTNSIPATPTNDNTWNTWSSLASCGYSQSTPYLWKCIKTVYLNGNGTTETEYLVEGPTVWGQDGADAIFIDLDNEMDAIPCDSTGKVTVATTLVTYARLYRGSAIINDGLTAPVAANCKLGSVTPTITPQQDGAYKLEWVFAVNTQLSADRLTASIAIGYASKSYPAVFTANVVKSGAPGVSPAIYQLLLSQNDASFARNSSNQLTPASISVRCGYTKNYNGSIVKHDGDQASDLQNIDGTYNILYRAIAANGSPGNWAWMKDLSSSNFYLVIPNSTTNTAYEFILTTANSASAVAESNIFDRETLPINKDGLNGAPGESALIIDLDNEQDAFGTKANGKIAAAVSRETTASMFYGITPLSATYSTTKTYEDGTTCGSEVSVDVNSETGKITVTMGSTSHVYNKTIFIDITGTASGYTDKPKTARFTIQPQAAGTDGLTPVIYQLMPSPSSLSFARNADGTLNMANNVITGYVKKIVDEETTILSSLSGYRIYYGYGNPATPSNFISVGGTITVSASNAASYASLVLELWKMNGSTKEKRLDRETIPINKEGQKGQQGDPGDPGNGINGIYFYRMFTQSFEAPAENDSGWIASTSGSYPTEAGLTKENRYLWQKKLTSYTRSDNPTIEISLLAQFDSGVQENLLEDTAFLSEGQMEAWDVKNGGININSVGAHNGFGYTPVWADQYTEMLRQNVYKYGELQKLKPNTWYTLSFYGAMQAYQDLLNSSVYNGSDGGSYWQIGASRRGFWLEAGQQAIVTVTGRCYSSNVYLKVFGFEQNWESGLTTSVNFTSTSSQTKSFLVKNTSSANKYFYVEGYVYLSSDDSQNTYTDINHRCYITLIRVDRGCKMASYLCRSDNGQAVQHSSSAPWYVDGKKYTAATTIPNPTGGRNVTLVDGTTANVQDGTFVGFANDGYVYWQLSPGTYRHSVTFKTPSSLSKSAQYRVLFRLISRSHYGWISMPKLEENTIATDWIENTNDRMADDIQHVYDGPWESEKTYFYGGGTGVRHVVRAKESVSGAMTYWRMKQRTTSSGYTSTTQPYNDTSHWEKASYLKFLASDFALIENAIINFQQTNRILVYNSAGVVAAGMGGAEGGSTDYPLWVGADYANRATAPFRVNLLGKLYATGVELVGTFKTATDVASVTITTENNRGAIRVGASTTGVLIRSTAVGDSNHGNGEVVIYSYANPPITLREGMIDCPYGNFSFIYPHNDGNSRRLRVVINDAQMSGAMSYGVQKSSYFGQGYGMFVIMDANLTLPAITDETFETQFLLIFNTGNRTIYRNNQLLYVDGASYTSASITIGKNSLALLRSDFDSNYNYAWFIEYIS